MNINRREILNGMAGSTLALLPAGRLCAQDSNALLESAKREGQVVIYSSYVSTLTHGPIAKAFEAKYGIKVETFQTRGPEMRERVRIEQMTGRMLGDIQHHAMTTTSIAADKDDNIETNLKLASAARLKPEFAARVENRQVPIFTINYGFLVNSDQVKPGEEPRSWQDLLDPRWRGRILCDDPRATGGGRVMFHMTMDKFGRQFHERLAAQKPVFSRDYGEAGRRLARGEFAIYIPLIFSQFGPLRGLPVRAIIPEEGVTYTSYSVSILRGARHPNAARLMTEFYLSDEAQGIYANTGHGAVVNDLKVDLLPEMRPFAHLKPLIDEDFTRIESYLALAKEIYK